MVQKQPDIDCIYDFIYLDTTRLTSYLAQLDDDGILLSIKKTRQLTEEQKSLNSVGYNATKTAAENNETLGKQAERHYDSSSTALYSVIDRMDELGFIKRTIAESSIGQLLLCSGTITFQDIRMMRNLWDPIMKLALSEQGQGKNKAHKTKEIELFKTLVSATPHALLMTLMSDDNLLWSSLEEAHLKINSDDITLKHGACFSGQWHVLGILDAKPDEEIMPTKRSTNNEIFDGMMDVANAIRQFLGRPSQAYGIMPIAIFRTVGR